MSSSGTKKAGLLTACYKIGGFLEASVFVCVFSPPIMLHTTYAGTHLGPSCCLHGTRGPGAPI